MSEPIPETMTKARLLEDLLEVRREWGKLMKEIGEERMLEPGATGFWTVRDVIAHLTSYARWFVNAYDAHLRGEAPPLDGTEMLDAEGRNQIYHQQMQHLGLKATIAEARWVYQRLIELVEESSEEFLTEPQQFVGIPQPIIVWQPIKSEVCDHYRTHMGYLREWLERITVQ
ncbi:MAG TPA: ClbS/DfsB family four-helix bundle protein [Phototrophicaceae bacterium]|nr:ClbS/DfsB family four-helix bundle protein [Phototrophicaceae bacterium]